MSHLESQDAQLFVYLTWETRDKSPVLSDDQIRQAVYLAIRTRTRSLLCQVLAIGGTPYQIHMVTRFPASLPIATILQISREAAQEAISRQQEMLGGTPQEPRGLWHRDSKMNTLSVCEAAEAHFYLRRRIEA